MTPRPPTHREPTDEEMQCLPEGTLVLCTDGKTWQPTTCVGMKANWGKNIFAVPITKQEEARNGMHRNLRDEFAMAAITGIMAADAHGQAAFDYHNNPEPAATIAYRVADAMLAARNNQPEKV